MKGLEPPRREAPDPKSGAAANYATSAAKMQKAHFLNLGLQRYEFFNENRASGQNNPWNEVRFDISTPVDNIISRGLNKALFLQKN